MINKKYLVASFQLKSADESMSAKIGAQIAESLKNTGKDVDTFTIIPVEIYPQDKEIFYAAAKAEKESHSRPAIVGKYNGIHTVSDIILVVPNWWDSVPMAVLTFLDETDANGRRLIPVIVHSGDGSEAIEKQLRNFLPHTDVMPAISVNSNASDLASIMKEVEDSIEMK